jgi:hypothetical protein
LPKLVEPRLSRVWCNVQRQWIVKDYRETSLKLAMSCRETERGI